MSIRFPYDLPQLAGIQSAARRLRDMFPDIIVDVTNYALELVNVPAEAHSRVMHLAALQLIRARQGTAGVDAQDQMPILARVA